MNGQFEIGAITPSRYFATLAVTLGLLFAFVSPDSDHAFVVEVAKWQAQTTVPMLLLVLSHITLHRYSPFDRLNPWIKLAVSGATGVLLFSPLALMIDSLLEGLPEGESVFSEWLDELAGTAPPIVLSWIAINAPWILGFRVEYSAPNNRPDIAPNSAQESAHCELVGFRALIKKELGQDIVYLKAELHYLEVTTALGKVLILYNIKDAITELSQTKGIQCHRSYWVALPHIRSWEKSGRQAHLTLSNGEKIPVSRRNIEKVMVYINNLT